MTVRDQVYIKVKGRPHWSEPKWTGPHQVTEVSNRSVRIDKDGDSNWHHFAHCALVKTKQNAQAEIAGPGGLDVSVPE